MTAVAVVLLQAACCVGLGAAALRLLSVDDDLGAAEHATLAFAVGVGVLGWLLFPLGIAGYLSPAPLTAVLVVGAGGAVLLRRHRTAFVRPRLDAVGWALAALLAVAFAFDLAEAIAPPADADTLAYHFVLPKFFLERGAVVFVPRALEGAVPLLVHLTYVPPLALGGETALTLWTLASGWAAGALLYALARRHLGRNWSLAVALAFLTVPAMVFGAGAGQVEARIALFVLVSAWAAGRTLETGRIRYAVLAGLAAGFYAAAKYTGLLFGAAAGAAVMTQRRWFAAGAVFAAAMVAAGFQWYAWNAAHTGDPVFPMLYSWLGDEGLPWWNARFDQFFKHTYFEAENPLPHGPLWLLLYPFAATFGFAHVPDAGRVGFGPLAALILPMAACGAWRFRDRLRRHPLFAFAAIAAAFYVAWFFAGGSQRIRHLLPVLPLLLICATVAAERFATTVGRRRMLAGTFAVTLTLQLAGHAVFSLKYFPIPLSDADRAAFLTRNVNGYAAVPWINANLPRPALLLTEHRQLRYYLTVPEYFGLSITQAAVDMSPSTTDAGDLYRQLSRAGITHLLLSRMRGADGLSYPPPFDMLARRDCLTLLKSFQVPWYSSRSLPGFRATRQTLDVIGIREGRCLR